jgi:hypothetical protein
VMQQHEWRAGEHELACGGRADSARGLQQHLSRAHARRPRRRRGRPRAFVSDRAPQLPAHGAGR